MDWTKLVTATGEKITHTKFKEYHYGFDSGYCTKVGVSWDDHMFVLRVWQFTDDEQLKKYFDDRVIIIQND